MNRPIIIYSGYVVRYPLGGHVWAELQYLAGLKRLGYRVIFVEESGSEWAPCYDPIRDTMTNDPHYGIGVLKQCLQALGMEKDWCYVDNLRAYHGLSAAELGYWCRQSALWFSRARVNWLPEFASCRHKALVDVDPVLTQLQETSSGNRPSMSGCAALGEFDSHFTYGVNLTRRPGPMPMEGYRWQPTRPPVLADLIPEAFLPSAQWFTTVMNWSGQGAVEFRGERYGQKDEEMRRWLWLPQRVGNVLEVALGGPHAPAGMLLGAGWRVRDPLKATLSVEAYLDYIRHSRGEFSVVKNAYRKTRCGWFSDRTVAYLASGKPAIIQDCGFSDYLPCGNGLYAVETEEEVAVALKQINADYEGNCRAARSIAEKYFAAETVLGDLLAKCGLPSRGTPQTPSLQESFQNG